jgi:hypothetical protein
MSNTIPAGLIAPVYESLVSVSREFVGFAPAVQKDNGNFASAALGQTVTAFTVPQANAVDIVPGVTAPNDGDQVLGSINLQITRSKSVNIRWNGEEQLALNNAGPTFPPILRQQFQQGFRTLVNLVEQDLAVTAYQAASRASGTAGTAPFGTAGDLSDFAAQAQILDENGAPALPRAMIVNSGAMANLRGKQSVLFKVNEAGTDDLLRRGKVGAVEGFDIGYSPGIKAVVKGTGASYTTDTAGYAIGATSIALITGTGTVKLGDVVTFAGDTNKYVVAAGVAAPGTIKLQSPGLKVAIANSATAMTIGNSFTPNVSFSQDGLLLATRMPALPVKLDGTRGDMGAHQMIVDPFTGIAFDLGVYEQYHQIKFEIGLAWGTAAPNPEHISLLLG